MITKPLFEAESEPYLELAHMMEEANPEPASDRMVDMADSDSGSDHMVDMADSDYYKLDPEPADRMLDIVDFEADYSTVGYIAEACSGKVDYTYRA